jgi:inositol 1,4,5-triphosphate receptor type 1
MVRLEYMWTCSRFFISNGKVLFLVIYASMSLLGVFASPVFYSMQLLDIVNRFPSLSNVIRSVTKNSNQLLMAAMLELILVYIYAVLLFTFFFDHYQNDDIQYNESEKGDNLCKSLFHCIMSTLNFGLRAGGGIGDALPSNSYFNESKEVYYLRALNDLSFMMIIIVLFFNIIFGIIIDTFAGLRDEKAQMEDDMRNICFICGIDR